LSVIDGNKVTYTPALDYFGDDSFTFTANDGTADSNIATVSITVAAVNDAPVAEAQTVTTPEDTAKEITLVATDVDLDTLTYEIVDEPTHGSLSVLSGNTVTYTPAPNYFGADNFTFKTNDSTLDSNIATVSIIVTAVNDAPVAQAQDVTTAEDTAKEIILVATDIDGDTLTYSVVGQPAHGSLSVVSGNTVTYTPAPNYFGDDSFTFKANDSTVDSNIATVAISVTAVNDVPVAQDQTVTTDEDTAVAINLVATDVDNTTLTYSIVTQPEHGNLNLLSGNPLIYTPSKDYFGDDSFTFKANDGTADSDIATVTITVTPVNDVPVAQDQTVETDEDVAKEITLVGTDVDLDALTYEIVDEPTHGSLSVVAGNTVTYTPALDYNSSDSFTFKATDGAADSNIATVTITVTPVNDVPVAQDQTVETDEDVAKEITLIATDVDLDALTYEIVDEPTHGSLSVLSGNIVTYTPGENYYGTDSFTFKAKDLKSDSNVAEVTITVAAVNDAPVAEAQTVTTLEDTAKEIALVATDVDGDPLTYSIVVEPTHGNLSIVSGNIVTYTPALDYNGPDSFTFKATDGAADSNVATVTITVTAVNDVPVAQNQIVETDEDLAKDITLIATDVDLDTLTYEIVDEPTHGSLSTLIGNQLTYTPAPNYFGDDSFTFKANDGGTVDSNIATVSITVKAVNDAPVAEAQTVTTLEDTAKAFTLVATDADGDSLTYTVVVGPMNGTLSGTAPNLTYTPAPNYFGDDSFTFKANDGSADSNIATVAITVTEVNDVPVAQNQTVTTPEDTAIAINLVATDVDNSTLIYSIVAPPTHGSLSTLSGNQVVYTPNKDYHGTDSFTFKANDGDLDSNTATVTININSVNDAPVAFDDSYSMLEDGTLEVDAPGILANDLDDGSSLTAILVDDVSHGELILNANGSFTYTPDAYFNGKDSFTYQASDGVLLSTLAVVEITVTPVNDWVIANDDTYETLVNVSLVVGAEEGLLANDVLLDPNETVSIEIRRAPENGTLVINNDGSFTYVPIHGFWGTVTFEYRVHSIQKMTSQGGEFYDDATVTILVKPLAVIYLPIITK